MYVPSALMLQPFLDSQECHALNMPTTLKPKSFKMFVLSMFSKLR